VPPLLRLHRVDLAARRRAGVDTRAAAAAASALPLSARRGEEGRDGARASTAAAAPLLLVASTGCRGAPAVDVHVLFRGGGPGGVEAEHPDEHVEVASWPRQELELLDGPLEAVHLGAADEERLEAREEAAGGAGDGRGAGHIVEHLLPPHRLGPEHLQPGRERLVPHGRARAALGGVDHGAYLGDELAQAAPALVHPRVRRPVGLDVADELAQQGRFEDLHFEQIELK